MMFGLVRGLARFLLVLSLAPATGCLAVRWEDDEGNTHHLGSFYYELEDLEHGRRLHRVSIGADIRLTGEDRGLTLGLKRIDEVSPALVRVSDPEHLGDCVEEYLEDGNLWHEDSSEHPHEPELLASLPRDGGTRQWGFFYYKEPRDLAPTIVRTQHLGADWKRGPVGKGLDLGYSARFRVVGRALESDIVQIHSFDIEGDRNERLVMWSLDLPEPKDIQ